MEQYYLAALQTVPGLGSARINTLVSFFGSAQRAWQAARRDLFLCGCLDEAVCNNFIAHREKIDIHKNAEHWQKAGIKLCTLNDENYPALLKNIFSPPLLIYYRGELPDNENLIAVVGSRKATAYGRNAAQMLGADLAAAGFTVISGAARGIDTAAHQGALARGKTIAVLGCGVDIAYPPENARLLSAISEIGAVISEYPPGVPPQKHFFPARNRIINGLSKGVVVVEAAEKSGALITADYALEEGRDVFAVPGSIYADSSKGAHKLIKLGAKLVETAADILEEYAASSARQAPPPQVSEAEAKLLSVLRFDQPLGVEEIVLCSGMPVSTITYLLLQLELRGLVMQHSGQLYVRNAKEGIG